MWGWLLLVGVLNQSRRLLWPRSSGDNSRELSPGDFHRFSGGAKKMSKSLVKIVEY